MKERYSTKNFNTKFNHILKLINSSRNEDFGHEVSINEPLLQPCKYCKPLTKSYLFILILSH